MVKEKKILHRKIWPIVLCYAKFNEPSYALQLREKVNLHDSDKGETICNSKEISH